MNKKIVLVVCSLMLVSICSSCSNNEDKKDTDLPDESNHVSVVLMFGQSNMEGHTHSEYLAKTVGSTKYKEYLDGYEDIKISYLCSMTANSSHEYFVPTKIGQGYGVDRFGPEIGMAETFHNSSLKKPMYLIKFAQGATSLHNQWQPKSTGKEGSLYRASIDYCIGQLEKLEDEGLYPEIEAICWMQGEDDSSGSSYYDYGKYQEELINDFREEFNYYSSPKGIAFVDAGISDCTAWTHYESINKQKEECDKEVENAYYFSTIENGLKYNAEPTGAPDIYHYDSKYMVQLGNLFANEVLKVLN